MLTSKSERGPVTEDTQLPESESRPTVSGMVSEFSQETSLHGVKFIYNSCASKPRRLLWGLIVLAQLTAFVVVIVGQLQHVYTRPLLTKVITRYLHKLPFPAVTVCSRIERMSHSSLSYFENDVIRNVQNMNKTFFTSLTPEQYAAIDISQIYRKRHSRKSLVSTCSFGGNPCMSLVGKVWSKEVEVGLCDTVNTVNVDETLTNSSDIWSPGNQDTPTHLSRLVSMLPGTEAGLNLKVYLGDTDNTGVKIVLHDPSEKISLMNSEFLNLAPGTMNYIGVKVRQIEETLEHMLFRCPQYTLQRHRYYAELLCAGITEPRPDNVLRPGKKPGRIFEAAARFLAPDARRKFRNKFLPSPYKAFGDRECVMTSGDFRHHLVPHGRYTLRACHDACLSKSWHRFCGCSLETAEEMCDPIRIIDCTAKTIEAYQKNSLPNYDCDCPFPCEDIVFDTTLSSSPSFLDLPESERKNFVSVNIHFDRLRIESMEQVEDYTSEDVFASVGGQLGLFLGASIISLVEIVELLIRCAGRWFLGCSNTVNPNSSSR